MTPNQIKFCDEYLKDFNATRAYKAAYPSIKNDHSARTLGARLLTKVDIKKYIEERKAKQQSENEVKRAELIEELKKMGFAKVKKIGAKDKLKALELLSKMLGYDAPAEKKDSGILAELVEGFKEL